MLVKEEVPDNALEALGKGVDITRYVGEDCAGDKINRRIHIRILIFVNLAHIVWHPKCQATIDSSTFGYKVVALRTALDNIKGLRYNLIMIGVPINGPSYMFIKNGGVNSASVPDCNISKKHLGTFYYAFHKDSVDGM